MPDPISRPGMKTIATFPPEECPVVGLLEWQGRLFVATGTRLYVLVDETLHPVLIQDEEP